MGVPRSGLFLVLLVAAGCRSVPATAPAAPPEEPSPDDAPCSVERPLPARELVFDGPETPERAREVLLRFLRSLPPDSVRFRAGDSAEILTRHGEGMSTARRPCLLVRWEEKGNELHVQAGSPRGIGGEDAQAFRRALEFTCWIEGLTCREGIPSGCFLPEVPPGSPRFPWNDAVDAEFLAMGLVRRDDWLIAQGASIAFYGRPGEVAEWHADFDIDCEGPEHPALEIFHDAVPMDPEGESAVLRAILKRVTGRTFLR